MLWFSTSVNMDSVLPSYITEWFQIGLCWRQLKWTWQPKSQLFPKPAVKEHPQYDQASCHCCPSPSSPGCLWLHGSLAEDLALSSINAGETLPAPHFLTPFPCLLALPPESATVAWHSISGAYWGAAMLCTCWVSLGFVACSWFFCFLFLFWVSELLWQ